jgi:hypothetical protein
MPRDTCSALLLLTFGSLAEVGGLSLNRRKIVYEPTKD